MSVESNNKSPRVGLWWRILLGVSLALNLLVIGLGIGAFARFGGADSARRPPPALDAALYRELPGSDRRAFREAMRGVPSERWKNRRAQAAALGAALRAKPFDAIGVEELLSDYAQHRSEWQSALQAAWMDRVAAMNDSERAAYAERVEKALTHRSRDRRDRDKRKERE